MSGILDVIRECQCFLIIIKLGSKKLGKLRADLRCASQTHEGKASLRSAEWADKLLVAL